MELATLKLVTDEQLTLTRAEATTEALSHRPIKTAEVPKLIRARTSRRLDVDGVLTRSLPKLEAEKVRSSSE